MIEINYNFRKEPYDELFNYELIIQKRDIPQSGVMVAHKPHKLEVGRFDSSDCDDCPLEQGGRSELSHYESVQDEIVEKDYCSLIDTVSHTLGYNYIRK